MAAYNTGVCTTLAACDTADLGDVHIPQAGNERHAAAFAQAWINYMYMHWLLEGGGLLNLFNHAVY